MYKTIIFDLDNTLLDYEQSERVSMERTLKEHRVFADQDDEQWAHFWQEYPKHSYRHWFDFVSGGEVKSVRDVLVFGFRDTLRRNNQLHEQLADTYWDYFCHLCIFEEGAEEILAHLKGKYQLGIITNGLSDSQWKRLRAGNIDDMFASVVISDEVGVRKPAKEIFDIALRELGAERHEVLYVGDSLEDDLGGAMNAGIDFCLYNRKKVALPKDVEAKYVIEDLRDLINIV